MRYFWSLFSLLFAFRAVRRGRLPAYLARRTVRRLARRIR